MVALRALWGQDQADPPSQRPDSPPLADANWLSVQQAACELAVSETTLRRMIRGGRLHARTVVVDGRNVRRVHMPGARHVRVMGTAPANVIDIETRQPITDEAGSQDVIRRLERQVEDLSEALARALRTRQRSIPAALRLAVAEGAHPYAPYRWLSRRRRWWPFA